MSTAAEVRSLVAFHLTGRAAEPTREPLRPLLLARYRDLPALRYDFPVVLVDGPAYEVRTLTEIVDEMVRAAAGADGDRIFHHAIRVEREVRTAVANGARGRLSTLWDAAADPLGPRGGAPFQDSLRRLRAALTVDGEVRDCAGDLTIDWLHHRWRATQARKAAAFHARVERLLFGLRSILAADHAWSDEGRSAEALRASVGGPQAALFDFGKLSAVLVRSVPAVGLPPARRERIEGLVRALSAQRFWRDTGGHSFVFRSASAALAAWRDRLPEVVELIRAMAVAELELDAAYRDAEHDALFADFGAGGIDPRDLDALPDSLVVVAPAALDAEEATIVAALAAGLPLKFVVSVDDLLERSPLGGSEVFFALKSRRLAGTVLSTTGAFVLQGTAAGLPALRGAIDRGLNFHGPALFSVFSGATPAGNGVPPYLVAAAAAEARVFPTFVYDPSAGDDWAARFTVADNPQPDADWPSYDLVLEDEHHNAVRERVTFTALDFAALDPRCARHFSVLGDGAVPGALVASAEAIARPGGPVPDKVPAIPLVDGQSLRRAVVDAALLREARRCRDQWRSLQELGGIHNSYAARALAQAPRPEAAAAPAPVAEEAPSTPVAAPSSGDPYIETSRCTTCNECIRINGRMFKYDANNQATVADPAAGTYAQLVEAAETCKVSIIHPGKPRNAKEPGLDALIERARPFA